MKRVLSLFNGMGCGQIALTELGIEHKYYYSEVDKFANYVQNLNFLNSVHLGDVTKWKEWGIDWNFDLVLAGSPCFVAGTKILTSTGYKEIEFIKEGDFVLTHKNDWQKVVKIGGERKETIIVKSQGLFDIKTTGNHPFYVRRMIRKWDNKNRTYYRYFHDPEWINACDLKKDYFLAMPILKDEINIYNLTLDECFVLGRYIADGHTSKHYRKSENRPNDRHWQLILSIGNKKNFQTSLKHSTHNHTENVERMIFCNKRLVQIAEMECGCGAMNKKIGINLLKLPKIHLRMLLDGIESGDGYIQGTKIKITSISKKLVQSIQLAVSKVYNVGSNVTYTQRPKKTIIEGRIVNQNDTYEVHYNKERQKQDNYYVDENHIWYRYNNTVISSSNKVYNLEVENDNSYIAENCVVHNCQGFSFAGKQLNFNDERSRLFFVFVDILDHIKKINPDVKFLLENVQMKKEYMRIISEHVGLFPVMINSALVSAQNRERNYWTNIRTKNVGLFEETWTDIPQPGDKGIYLKDILQPENEVDEKYYLKNFDIERGKKTHAGKVWKSGNKMGNMDFPNDINKKSKCITSTQISGARETNHILTGLDTEKKAPTQRASTGRCLDDKHNYQIIKLDRQLNLKNNQNKASSLTIGGHGAGNHSDMDILCVSMVGRRLDENGIRKDNDKSIPAEQRLEANTDGKTGCLTSVQKDNLILLGGVEKGQFKEGKTKDFSQGARVYSEEGKSTTINSGGGGLGAKTGLYITDYRLRRLTPLEAQRLQTVPEWFNWGNTSDTQKYKMLGNGWTVDVIKWILRFWNEQH